MSNLFFLKDSYLRSLKSKITHITPSISGVSLTLKDTIFSPGPSPEFDDAGTITSTHAQMQVKDIDYNQGNPLHLGPVSGEFEVGDEVTLELDWHKRYSQMQQYTALHLLRESIQVLVPELRLIEVKYSQKNTLIYQGILDASLAKAISAKVSELISQNLNVITRFIPIDQFKQVTNPNLGNQSQSKLIRAIQIADYLPFPDILPQVAKTSEVGQIKIISIDYDQSGHSLLAYTIDPLPATSISNIPPHVTTQPDSTYFHSLLTEFATDKKSSPDKESLRIKYLGRHGLLKKALDQSLRSYPDQRSQIGKSFNQIKSDLEQQIESLSSASLKTQVDPSLPGILPPLGHLHPVSVAIDEISSIFEKIGFTRVRYPEVDWDWYPFEALNMEKNHPARDDWETFFVNHSDHPKLGKMLLTPHTSNGQVREMERLKSPPIRMINIAKCYRRQSDVSHTPMFHQFEGLVVDKNISIVNLKGTIDYFVQQFFGANRISRLRPYHFQFTEPSFEVDITCDICLGSGCRLCKEGWLELGGAGMVHPVVLANGGIDPNQFSGFAFGWGVERTYMMKSGIKIDDIRLLYGNDIRFLNQF